jgi:hypothetical protein
MDGWVVSWVGGWIDVCGGCFLAPFSYSMWGMVFECLRSFIFFLLFANFWPRNPPAVHSCPQLQIQFKNCSSCSLNPQLSHFATAFCRSGSLGLRVAVLLLPQMTNLPGVLACVRMPKPPLLYKIRLIQA